MNSTRVRLRAGLATVLAGLVVVPALIVPAAFALPVVALLAVAASWWLVPAEAFGPTPARRS